MTTFTSEEFKEALRGGKVAGVDERWDAIGRAALRIAAAAARVLEETEREWGEGFTAERFEEAGAIEGNDLFAVDTARKVAAAIRRALTEEGT